MNGLTQTTCSDSMRDKAIFTAHIKNYPAPTYTINVSESFQIHCSGKIPNWFQRKMHKICFGWNVTVL